MAPVNLITLPHDVLERVERVLGYHADTKNTHESVRVNPHRRDPATKPYEFRIFEMLPRTRDTDLSMNGRCCQFLMQMTVGVPRAIA